MIRLQAKFAVALRDRLAERTDFLLLRHIHARGQTLDPDQAHLQLHGLKERLKSLRTNGGRTMLDYVRLHLRGYERYYGVSGNSGPLRAYFRQAARLLFKWLNRRSQRKSLTWARFLLLWKQGLIIPKPRVVHHLYPAPTRMR